MRNFFYKVQNALARFMYGRNGNDQLNMALFWAYLICWILGSLVTALLRIQILVHFFNALMLVLAVALIWRTFSKNLPKRRAENARFLEWWYPTKNKLQAAKQRRKDKDHKYFTCKHCKTICRVPVGKGKIEITCPKCGEKIIGKS